LYQATRVCRKFLTLPMVELLGKLLQNRLVLALRTPNQRSTRLRIPKVACLHLSLRLLSASGYRGPLSTGMRALFLHVSRTPSEKGFGVEDVPRPRDSAGKCLLGPHVHRRPDVELLPVQLELRLVHGHHLSALPFGPRQHLPQPPEPEADRLVAELAEAPQDAGDDPVGEARVVEQRG